MDACGAGARSSTRVGVAVFDEGGRHVFANGEYAALYGYDEPAELLDEHWDACLPSSHDDCVTDGDSGLHATRDHDEARVGAHDLRNGEDDERDDQRQHEQDTDRPECGSTSQFGGHRRPPP